MQGTRQEPNSIQIGWVRVDFSAIEAIGQACPLSAADHERAERFKRPEDRLRFMLGRALLSTLLRQAGVTEALPLQLTLSEHGKPHLPAAPAVHFSITHAGGIVAVALTLGARVGVDVEEIDRPVDFIPLAERIFNAPDLTRFRTVTEADQPRAFFRAWTGKEAVLKAKGVGLFGGIQEIAVPLDDRPATLPAADGETSWRLHPLQFPAGYVGCAACDDTAREIRQHEFTWQQLLD